jgi:hypothetical protein
MDGQRGASSLNSSRGHPKRHRGWVLGQKKWGGTGEGSAGGRWGIMDGRRGGSSLGSLREHLQRCKGRVWGRKNRWMHG